MDKGKKIYDVFSSIEIETNGDLSDTAIINAMLLVNENVLEETLNAIKLKVVAKTEDWAEVIDENEYLIDKIRLAILG